MSSFRGNSTFPYGETKKTVGCDDGEGSKVMVKIFPIYRHQVSMICVGGALYNHQKSQNKLLALLLLRYQFLSTKKTNGKFCRQAHLCQQCSPS